MAAATWKNEPSLHQQRFGDVASLVVQGHEIVREWLNRSGTTNSRLKQARKVHYQSISTISIPDGWLPWILSNLAMKEGTPARFSHFLSAFVRTYRTGQSMDTQALGSLSGVEEHDAQMRWVSMSRV